MPMCERCWGNAYMAGSDQVEEYYRLTKEAEERNEICTQDTEEGRRARAGQFWDEERNVDIRTLPKERDDA